MVEVTFLRVIVAFLTPALCILYAYLIGASVVLTAVTLRARHPSSRGAVKSSSPSWLIVAGLCLAATWYYMFAFLHHSYLAFHEPRACSSRDSLQLCFFNVARRADRWLRATSLFEQAWLEVTTGDKPWWFSADICSITVGAWALRLREDASRFGLDSTWRIMLLGQMVAISVAQSLTMLALASLPATPISLSLNPWSLVAVVESLLLVGGCAVIWTAPQSLLATLVMHAFPLALVCLPPSSHRRSPVYGALAAYAFVIKVKTTHAVLRSVSSYASAPTALVLTFFSHPAQSSISSDNIGITCVTLALIGWEWNRISAPRPSLALVAALSVATPIIGPSCALASWSMLRARSFESNSVEEGSTASERLKNQ